MRRGDLLRGLEDGSLLPRLEPVYGGDAVNAAERLSVLMREYAEIFPCGEDTDVQLFSAPGRTELGGNHTDHQHGHCLAAAVGMDTIACAARSGTNVIRIKSRHHRMAEVSLDQLDAQDAETGSSPSLVRGVAARLTQMGYTVGGFDAYTTTQVLRGSGISSSAAFEVLVCAIMNHLFCGDQLSPIQLAQVGQYAENVYYGKPCGLLDQLSCACGGVIAAGFSDPSNPSVHQVQVDLAAQGYALCIVDAGASHASLIDDYASIPQEMRQAAAHFGKEVLGEVPYKDFQRELPAVRDACGDRAVLLAQAEELLGDRGACRIHGGGFAGTIQAFVPQEKLEMFKSGMEAPLGPGKCHVLCIRPQGGCVITE